MPHLTGAALLGGGDFVVLVDPARLAERAVSGLPRMAIGGPTRHKVLVVDDSLGVRQVVGQRAGFRRFRGLAGGDGHRRHLRTWTRASVDAIVLDYVLPEMDGATLVRTVRARGITAPIVVLSGLATPRDQAVALEAGADLYFDKDDVRKGALAEALGDLIASAAVRA